MVEYLLPWKQKWRTLLFVGKKGNKGNVITFAYSCTQKMWKCSHIAHEGGGLGLGRGGTEKGKGVTVTQDLFGLMNHVNVSPVM